MLVAGLGACMIDPSRDGYPCSPAARAAALRRGVPDRQPARSVRSLPLLAPAAPCPADLAGTASPLLRIDPVSRGHARPPSDGQGAVHAAVGRPALRRG